MSKNRPFIHQEERKGDATLTFLPQPESASWLHINQAGNTVTFQPEPSRIATPPWTTFLFYLRETIAIPASPAVR